MGAHSAKPNHSDLHKAPFRTWRFLLVDRIGPPSWAAMMARKTVAEFRTGTNCPTTHPGNGRPTLADMRQAEIGFRLNF
jgi:hypothetical protein